MNHGSLFSGIGGFDLAAEWIGWNNTFHCEWMPFPRKVLNHYWPNSISYEDITKTDFSIHRGTIDILTGGFPCQPYSSAGKRLGKEDERHLWPHMLRVISEVKPTYVVGENVRGLTNWNGGVVFEEVCVDLESQGYTVQPILLPACAVGAPHRRDRVWFIAKDTKRNGFIQREFEQEGTEIWEQRNACTGDSIGVCRESDEGITSNTECFRLQHSEKRGDIQESTGKTRCERSEFTESLEANGSNGFATNTDMWKCERRLRERKQKNSKKTTTRMDNRFARFSYNESNTWENFPTQSPICGGDDGLPTELDGITFSKWRSESIKGYGNAIVPQVAYEIFKVIAEMDRLEKLQLKLF
jgi:DNA (cytosine-5)-methyltransferase 1